MVLIKIKLTNIYSQMKVKLIPEDQMNNDFDEDEESKSTVVKIILFMILFSPLFSSAFIFIIFAGYQNKIYYVILMAILLGLSFYTIQYYRQSMKIKGLITF